MSDSHPNQITLEIDRPRLRRYLYAEELLPWLFFFCFFGGLCGTMIMLPPEDVLNHAVFARKIDRVLLILGAFAKAISLSLITGLIFHYIFRHRAISRRVDSLEITVEGPFLHIREFKSARMDRKLHFRSIVDYATMDGPLMRLFGISALQMTTTGGGLNSTITLPGVKNCLAARDLLSEIDSQRELS